MSTNSPQLTFTEIRPVEPIEGYEKGGYHPVQIGDRFEHRYRVVHKLGHGSSSTIWLARDEKLSRFTAIKVGMATSDRREMDIMTRLSNASADAHRGKSLIPTVLDRFDVHGPNGTHPCLVTAPAQCSLLDAIEASCYGPFQANVAKSLSAQLAMVVAYTHSAGLVHGDLHFGNLLLQLPDNVHGLSDQQLYDRYDHPVAYHVTRKDEQPVSSPAIPPFVYPPIWMGKPSDEIVLKDAKLVLVDFGLAFCPHEESKFDTDTPIQIVAPEAILDREKPLGFASDIWSLGCMIWATLGVYPFLNADLNADHAITSLVDALGPLPDEWWQRWEAADKTELFVKNGIPKEGRYPNTFEGRYEDCIEKPRRDFGAELFSPDEREAIFEMIKGMLRFDPGERMTADQVLETRWMRNWAIPEAEKTWGA